MSLIVDIIDKITGRLMGLAASRRDARNDIYDQIVKPTLDDVAALHAAYLDALAGYVAMIRDGSDMLDQTHPVFPRLRADATASGPLRARVQALDSLVPDRTYGRFAFRVTRYLQPDAIVSRFENGLPRQANAPRRALDVGIADIFAGDADRDAKLDRVEALAGDVAGELAQAYQKIQDEHLRLRAAALGLTASTEDFSAADRIAIRYEEKMLERAHGWTRLI